MLEAIGGGCPQGTVLGPASLLVGGVILNTAGQRTWES